MGWRGAPDRPRSNRAMTEPRAIESASLSLRIHSMRKLLSSNQYRGEIQSPLDLWMVRGVASQSLAEGRYVHRRRRKIPPGSASATGSHAPGLREGKPQALQGTPLGRCRLASLGIGDPGVRKGKESCLEYLRLSTQKGLVHDVQTEVEDVRFFGDLAIVVEW